MGCRRQVKQAARRQPLPPCFQRRHDGFLVDAQSLRCRREVIGGLAHCRQQRFRCDAQHLRCGHQGRDFLRHRHARNRHDRFRRHSQHLGGGHHVGGGGIAEVHQRGHHTFRVQVQRLDRGGQHGQIIAHQRHELFFRDAQNGRDLRRVGAVSQRDRRFDQLLLRDAHQLGGGHQFVAEPQQFVHGPHKFFFADAEERGDHHDVVVDIQVVQVLKLIDHDRFGSGRLVGGGCAGLGLSGGVALRCRGAGYCIPHAAGVVVDAHHVALRAVAGGVIRRAAGLGIAALRARAVHVQQLDAAGAGRGFHIALRLPKSYVDRKTVRWAVQMGGAGPVVGIVELARAVHDRRGEEQRVEGGAAGGVQTAGVVHDALEFLGVGQPPVAIPGVIQAVTEGQRFRPVQAAVAVGPGPQQAAVSLHPHQAGGRVGDRAVAVVGEGVQAVGCVAAHVEHKCQVRAAFRTGPVDRIALDPAVCEVDAEHSRVAVHGRAGVVGG